MPDLDEKNLATRFQKKSFTLGMSLIIISLSSTTKINFEK